MLIREADTEDWPAVWPFFHEIVSAEAASDPHAAIELTHVHWPCLMVGELLFSRAGCTVNGGADHLDPKIAGHSVLYWAHRRRARRTTDLSVGWGSNSQWRTRFRRDCWRAQTNEFRFNVDARPRPDSPCEQLEPAERLELLTNRCFIRSQRDDSDLWPYDEQHATR